MDKFGIICLFVLSIAVVYGSWMIVRRKSKLDRLYHDALHAESIGEYDQATGLYQAILDRPGGYLLLDRDARSYIKQRIDTLRLEQDYLSQFTGKTRRPLNAPFSKIIPS